MTKENHSDVHVTMYAEVKRTRDKQTECGLGYCRPRCMQPCASPACFAGFYSIAGLLTSTVSMYLNSQITTLERYFGFSSSATGFLMSCNDIGFLLTTIFISSQAHRLHIPRTLSASTIFFGFSGLICTLSYLFSPTFMTEGQGLRNIEQSSNNSFSQSVYASASQGGPLCNEMNKSASCDSLEAMSKVKIGAPTEYTQVALLIIALGMILQGFAKAPRHPFVTCYIDDNVEKTKTALYLGIIMALGVFGPAIAFGAGGVFSRVFITLEGVNISPRDPRWVGAWWLGFLVFGSLGILSGIPLCFFPKRFKPKIKTGVINKKKVLLVEVVKDVFWGLWDLLKNRLYVLMLTSTCLTLFTVSGNISFMPKYLETQFSIPTWKSNVLMGVLAVVAASLGSFLGGCLTSKFKLSPPACAKFVLAINVITIIVPVLGLFLGCDNAEIVGLSNTKATLRNIGNSSNANCSFGCECNQDDFFPVCGSDGRNYFSPCHGGCAEQTKQSYSQCDCMGNNGTAVPGFCESDCKMLYPYMVLTFFGGLSATFAIMPGTIFAIRCVKEKEKSLSLGLSSFLNSLVGWMLGPIVMGKIIDTSCLVWTSSCYGQGSCALYDIEDFRLKRHITEISVKVGVILLQMIMVYLAIKKKDWTVHSDNETVVTAEEKSPMVPTINGTKQ